jgi:uncharacterized membrane protein YvbJ
MKHCSKCGESNHEDARYCIRCGNPLSAAYTDNAAAPASHNEPIPDTYLWQSIVVTILCCLPLGIPAIVYATQVEKYFFNGNIDAAKQASNKAKNFCIWSLVSGLVVLVAYILYFVTLGGMFAGALLS